MAHRPMRNTYWMIPVSPEVYDAIIAANERGVSMVRPSVDHYIGYPISGVRTFSDNAWDWGLVLGNEIILRNHDESRTDPPAVDDVAGRQILMVEMDDTNTILKIGHLEDTHLPEPTPVFDYDLIFTAVNYSIADPRYSTDDGDAIFPQREDESIVVPVDPSPERVVEGPETPLALSEDEDGAE
jgi:hypothetical protein